MRKIACVGRVVGTQVPRYPGRCEFVLHLAPPPLVKTAAHGPCALCKLAQPLLIAASSLHHQPLQSAPLHQHHHHFHHEQHPDILILHCTFSSTVSASLSRTRCHATDCSNRGLRLWFSGAGLWGATWSTASARAWRTSLCAAETLRRIRRASVAVAVAVH